MVMGSAGKPDVAVGGTPVPVGAFGNMIGALAARAESEYEAATIRGSVPEYLKNYAGEARVDPAVAESRAEALFELLEASAPTRESAESGEFAEFGEGVGEVAEWEADAAELLELAEGSESEYY